MDTKRNNNGNSNRQRASQREDLIPNSDSINMFVEQIPLSMGEQDLRNMFMKYGRVHSITVLRDQTTGASTGCCTVRFFTRRAALLAQASLHNKKILNEQLPIQMYPVGKDNRDGKQLYVGMLNKKLDDNNVRTLFRPYGLIEECRIVRDNKGKSTGCAIVTFASKKSAAGAIQALHNSQTMHNCPAPLIVKYQDTPWEKLLKSEQHMLATREKLLKDADSLFLQAMSSKPVPPQRQLLSGGNVLAPIGVQNLRPTSTIVSDANSSRTGAEDGITPAPGPSHQLDAASSAVAGRRTETFDGRNLFVCGLPPGFADKDLAAMFLPFGPLLSAKVIFDRQTKQSKCYGFVSFVNALSAHDALRVMHGSRIGAYRLKVEYKRSFKPRPGLSIREPKRN